MPEIAGRRFSNDDSFCEVIWNIENFCCSWHGPGLFFNTGSLGIQVNHSCVTTSDWILRLYPRGFDGKSSICVRLYRRLVDRYYQNVSLLSEISLLDVNNQPSFLTFFRSEFTSDCLSFNLAHFEDLLKKKDLYLPQDTLTIRYRISLDSVLHSQDIFVHTKLHIQRISVIWPIRNFESDVTNSCKVTFPFVEKFFTQPANLTLSLKNVQQSDWVEFNLENIALGSYDIHFQCRTTLFRSNELYAYTDKNINQSSSSLKWTVKPLLSYEEVLKAAKSSTDSRLEAKCEFLLVNKVPDTEKVCGEPFIRIKSCDRKLEPESTNVMATKDFLKPDLKNMYKEGLFSDLSLQVQSDSYAVHSAILAARSPVIRSMLESDMQEKTTRTIVIKDLDSETCSRMLDYFYTDDPGELDVHVACKLYYAGDKYQVPGLKITCTSFLKGSLNKDNVFNILVLADLHQDEDLKNFVVEHICKNKNSLSVEKWHSFMQDHSLLAATITLKVFQSK